MNNNELDRMKELCTYGLNENTVSDGQSSVEFHQVGPDGKTYGIIREGKHFYIKVAPRKDTEVLAEDYDYIGGFMNKKAYEYSSYASASKNFDFKMMSLKEAAKSKEPIMEQFNPAPASEWQIEETKEMRAEIDRFRQITENVSGILGESEKPFTLNHTTPEAPKTNSDPTNAGGDPYTEKSVYTGEKDLNKTANDPKKADDTFSDEADPDMESDKNPRSGSKANGPFTSKASYAPEGAVANTKKSGGKAVKMNENKHTLKLTESQILAWKKSLNEEFEGEDTPFKDALPKDTDEIPYDDEYVDPANSEETLPEDPYDYYLECNFKGSLSEHVYKLAKKALKEGKINDYGKQHTFRKPAMTTPPAKGGKSYGREWDDESAKSEEPYATKIGKGDPFTEKTIDILTDAIVKKLRESKKKVK